MTYDVVTPPNRPAPDPRILCHPNIPKPLQGVAPREIAGGAWWKRQREAAIRLTHYRCMACDTHLTDVLGKNKWLEGHEFYEYDYEHGRLIFKKVVALCPYCHQFVHSGRTEILYSQGTINEETYEAIMKHGTDVLKKAGILNIWKSRHDHACAVRWEDWRLVFNGKEYGPSSRSFLEWEEGLWKKWKPTGKEKSV